MECLKIRVCCPLCVSDTLTKNCTSCKIEHHRNLQFPVCACLDNHFTRRWIGRQGKTEWLRRRPDINPCPLLWWGWCKQEVCQSQPRTIYELKQQIRNNFAAVDLHFLRKSFESVSSRLYPSIIKWARIL